MRYVSTRGEAPPLDFAECLLAGLARDGGLYLPESWPVLSPAEIAGMAGWPFHRIASRILTLFAGNAIPEAVIAEACREAYAGFGHAAVTPLVQIAPNRFVLELFHGPTLAFKDVAMQVLARLMDHALAQRGERATIVGATSGDTGGAAIEAFRASKRADVYVLFPDGRVSNVQRRMMTTPTEPHLHALSISGTFDDCQALVKGLFNHHAFRDEVRLSGVNSINWVRIVAQVSYYFAAGLALGAPHRPVAFSVPTGNFGDVFAGYVAKRLGLPIARLIVATNLNDILARALATGEYATRGVAATSSPSMDIQVSSNFERLLFEANGRDGAGVRRMMDSLKQSGAFTLPPAVLETIRGEDEVAEAIRSTHAAAGYAADPHTATGLVAAARTTLDASVPVAVLATAAPAKFPEAMRDLAGLEAPLPARLAHLLTEPERIFALPNEAAALERHIRATRRGSDAR